MFVGSLAISLPGRVFEIVNYWLILLVNPSTTLRASPAPTLQVKVSAEAGV